MTTWSPATRSGTRHDPTDVPGWVLQKVGEPARGVESEAYSSPFQATPPALTQDPPMAGCGERSIDSGL